MSYIFGIPSAIFGLVENGYIENIVTGLNAKATSGNGSTDQNAEKSKVTNIIKIMRENKTKHWKIFVTNLVAQIVCLGLVVGFCLVMNYILNGHFLTYGLFFGQTGIVTNGQKESVTWDEMILPPVVQCTFSQLGHSGKTLHQNLDVMLIWSIVIRIELLILWCLLVTFLFIDLLYVVSMMCNVCRSSGRK